MKNKNIFLGLMIVWATYISFGFTKISKNSGLTILNTITNQAQQKTKEINQKVLIGNWARTDSDYKIKISEVGKEGKLIAGYFNPKSINVSIATWKNEKGVIKIYIELRDENYPGSNYNLTYYPEKDMLSGKYFQAVTGETYDILFTRVK